MQRADPERHCPGGAGLVLGSPSFPMCLCCAKHHPVLGVLGCSLLPWAYQLTGWEQGSQATSDLCPWQDCSMLSKAGDCGTSALAQCLIWGLPSPGFLSMVCLVACEFSADSVFAGLSSLSCTLSNIFLLLCCSQVCFLASTSGQPKATLCFCNLLLPSDMLFLRPTPSLMPTILHATFTQACTCLCIYTHECFSSFLTALLKFKSSLPLSI